MNANYFFYFLAILFVFDKKFYCRINFFRNDDIANTRIGMAYICTANNSISIYMYMVEYRYMCTKCGF